MDRTRSQLVRCVPNIACQTNHSCHVFRSQMGGQGLATSWCILTTTTKRARHANIAIFSRLLCRLSSALVASRPNQHRPPAWPSAEWNDRRLQQRAPCGVNVQALPTSRQRHRHVVRADCLSAAVASARASERRTCLLFSCVANQSFAKPMQGSESASAAAPHARASAADLRLALRVDVMLAARHAP